jgi:hypothetical protein
VELSYPVAVGEVVVVELIMMEGGGGGTWPSLLLSSKAKVVERKSRVRRANLMIQAFMVSCLVGWYAGWLIVVHWRGEK